MSPLTVRLFGKFSVRRNGQESEGLSGCKIQELFCYLLLHRDRGHTRECLASLLWADSPSAQSRKYLRQALWQLQSALHAQVEVAKERTLLAESDSVRLKTEDGLWLDVAEFERAFALVRGVPGPDLHGTRVAALQAAVELYKGDLLEGWYQDWCLCERERLQGMYLAMLDKLMDYCTAHRDYENGAAYGARILRCDPARECTHQRLMRLRYLAGDRAGALRQYQRCAAALAAELGVQPAEGTVGLYDQIRTGRLEGSAGAAIVKARIGQSQGSLVDVLSHLKQLEAALIDLQRRVQENIGIVGQLVGGERRRPQQAVHAGRTAPARRASGN
jgi:DNA-binding SARP family transcriptional activator